MKKTTALFLLALCLLLFALPAAADVVVEPIDDFYEAHAEDCHYMGRSFYTNGEGGSVAIYESPEKSSPLMHVKNGVPFYIDFTYTGADGKEWGMLYYALEEDGAVIRDAYGSNTAWLQMADAVLQYDSQAFLEEFAAELHPYTGVWEPSNLEDIALYTWPGSGEVAHSISNWSVGDPWPEAEWSYAHAYTDSEGREWGYVAYQFGQIDLWVCISDPANTALPATLSRAPTLKAADANAKSFPEGSNVQAEKKGFPVLPVVLIAAVVAGTAVLIAVLMRKKKK